MFATKLAKYFSKTKKKNSTFDGLNRSYIIVLLKQKWKDEEEDANANSKEEEEDDQESKASLEASVTNDDPYYPYNQELFGHDEPSTLDLGED